MSWKPRHEAHAIERVRVMLPFKEPITSKLLSTSSGQVVQKASELGFDSVVPANSSVQTLNINIAEGSANKSVPQNGTVLYRHAEDEQVEELGFRDGAFGYVTTRYGRWKNLASRLDEVLLGPMQTLQTAAELDAIKLEYWDAFRFDGPPEEASVETLLEGFNTSLPSDVVAGSSQWHSHIGWFEATDFGPLLINRNFDAVDRDDKDQNVKRDLLVYTMVEQRNQNGISIADAGAILEVLHNRSLLLFGSSLSEDYRSSIGIKLEEYQ